MTSFCYNLSQVSGKKKKDVDYSGEAGEQLFSLRALKLNLRYESFGDKMPSVDGMLLLRDPVSGAYCWFLNVQIKTGLSYRRRLKKVPGAFSLKVKSEYTKAWNESNVPTIIIWVDNSTDPEKLYWRDARFAKSGSSTLRMKYKNIFDSKAIPHLLNLAREHSGRLNSPQIQARLLFPSRVSDVKRQAWIFYNGWRNQNSVNPYLKKINVTLKGWRHITQQWRPQTTIISRLALLEYAKEIIEKSSSIRHLRTEKKGSVVRDIFRISGNASWKWRSPAIIDVLVERTYGSGEKAEDAEFSFLSVYERRNI